MAIDNRELIDDWATETLKQLILSTHLALGERPPEIPGYLESEIVSNGIRAKIRVDFCEDYETSNGTPQVSNRTLPKALLDDSQERKQAIQFTVVIWAVMIIFGGLLYWGLVIAG